jgi:hypothetical protein
MAFILLILKRIVVLPDTTVGGVDNAGPVVQAMLQYFVGNELVKLPARAAGSSHHWSPRPVWLRWEE